MVTLGSEALSRFPRFTLYNSPYAAHREGRAIDLYPDTDTAPSPVAGEVVETMTRSCPSRPYAADHDHLIVVDTGERLARMLHVEPAVEPGDGLDVGDPLGTLIRSGYFAPWVDNHIHLGFREYGTDAVRASGSLRLDVEVPIDGVPWDGRGTVVETGDTYAILDVPAHPAPGEAYVGITDDSGEFVIDGGLPHYENGGLLAVPADSTRLAGREGSAGDTPRKSISLLGAEIGPATGRELAWDGTRVVANGVEITGLSFFFGREEIYAKLITPDTGFEVGDAVEVEIDTARVAAEP